MLMPEMTKGPGLDTLNVWAGEFTTLTFLNVPEILILYACIQGEKIRI